MKDPGISITNLSVSNYSASNPPQEIKAFAGYFNVDAEIGVDKNVQKVKVVLRIKIDIKPSQAKGNELVHAGSIETMTEFSFDDWEKHLLRLEGKTKARQELEYSLIQIAYDSTRGLLREKGKGDIIGRVILPVLNPQILKRSNTDA